jgi:GTP-binding protein EngB required for normal cell division
MFSSIFNALSNFFSSTPSLYELVDIAEKGSLNKKIHALKNIDQEIYQWIQEAKPYVSESKIEKIAYLAIFKHLAILASHKLQNELQQTNNFNPDQMMLKIEKEKLKELKEMSWRQAFDKRI